MKALILITILILPSLTEACLCNGITPATCDTAPCTIRCGLCRSKCCALPFIGRSDLDIDEFSQKEEDRLLIPCLLRDYSIAVSPRELDPGDIADILTISQNLLKFFLGKEILPFLQAFAPQCAGAIFNLDHKFRSQNCLFYFL